MNFMVTYHFYQKEKKVNKVKKLVTNLYDKNEYVLHIRNIMRALNYRSILKKANV